ncbi:MAG: hypothetical protein U0840_30380 [Gemmataceae bacterium]
MAKKRPWQVDYLVYLVVRVIICLVQMLTWYRALQLAEFLGWLLHRVDRRHRQVAAENIRHAFPDMNDEAIARLVHDTYQHWAHVVIEMIRMPRTLRPNTYERYYYYPEPDQERRALWLSRNALPSMLVSGHFGNFEALSYILGLHETTGSIIARRLDNPYLDAFLQRFRQSTGQQILDKNLDYERILDELRQGGRLGMVGDQDAGPRGVFVDFLGRPASTFKSIALLCIEFQAPMLVMGAARVGKPMRFALYLEDVIYPHEYAHRPDAVAAITQRYTNALERMVRRHPEQYFWLHRRWKHQPKARAKKAA